MAKKIIFYKKVCRSEKKIYVVFFSVYFFRTRFQKNYIEKKYKIFAGVLQKKIHQSQRGNTTAHCSIKNL